MTARSQLTSYAWLSIAAALLTIGLKTAAWRLTGSVGLLSDALESLVNLAGAAMTLWMLSIAAQPEDEKHAHGHSKAEYFASGFEGCLILLTALLIMVVAAERFFHPEALTEVGLGAAVSMLSALVNFIVARILAAAGRRRNAIALTADARHLMTDVWTSLGIIAGVLAVKASGWLWLDPLFAVLVAIYIAWTGAELLSLSVSGLMDKAVAPEKIAAIEAALAPYRAAGVGFHALRTREAGARVFVSLHVLVPGKWSVQKGHDTAEGVEAAIRGALSGAHVLTHVEPIEDPASHLDLRLDSAA
ncbi:MAG: cation diffusion facilitator family transporter [Zoogloeaceae bacterium]|jgi:cation diffusion facilitator family transporter|nr:cation diffusion facilitator family transporter [Zoogloeaceae bacterium]